MEMMKQYHHVKKEWFPLRKKQIEAVQRLKTGQNTYLDMDMGTGKSLTILHYWSNYVPDKKILILAPAYLVATTWKDEIAAWINLPYNQYGKKKIESNIGVCSIETWRYIKKDLIEFTNEYEIIVIDESTKIKSHKALQSKNIIKYTSHALQRIAMSGTCVSNNLSEAYNQYHFIEPRIWAPIKSHWEFENKYCVKRKPWPTAQFEKTVGYRYIDDFVARIKPYTVSARIEECEDMPEKIYTPIYLEPTDEEMEQYQIFKKFLRIELDKGPMIARNKAIWFGKARQLVGEWAGKKDYLREDIETHGKKSIVWCSFIDDVRRVGKEMENAEMIYGDVILSDRIKSVERFRDDGRVLVCSMAAAYGLNLQFSNVQYWYSNTLSPEMRLQAEARQYRLGQSCPVIIKDLIYTGTVDERIYELQQSKKVLREHWQAMDMGDQCGIHGEDMIGVSNEQFEALF
jgi:SNF2 family DNA or RNA helicase